MRPPAKIKEWQSRDEMIRWVQASGDIQTHCRRMAIWLTRSAALHAHKVAEALGVSKQAVWLWIRQYNRNGPAGLDRRGRGGSRRTVMTEKNARTLVARFQSLTLAPGQRSGRQVQEFLSRALRRSVSLSYAYQFLRDCERASAHSVPERDRFGNVTRPWAKESWPGNGKH